MTPEKYIAKAAHASRSARLLLEAGENDGACNRAYYAMFNAAHAALLWSGAHINPAETKKHNSLIAAFGRHLVLTGLIPSELGKSLNRAESVRILADYTGEEIEHQKVTEIVELSTLFINAIEDKFCPATKLRENSRPSALP